jgi:hypothetical protein
MYPLPEKMITTSPFNAEFLKHRRAGLQVFVEKTAVHPLLQQCPVGPAARYTGTLRASSHVGGS